MQPAIKRLVGRIIANGGIVIRDVGKGEDPFLYSSGNRGPGYIDIKGQCGNRSLSDALAAATAAKLVLVDGVIPSAVAGNVTGGLGPGWKLRDALSILLGYDLPYVYVRDTRKVGGHGEKVTGTWALKNMPGGDGVLVVEELVNFAETTCNSAHHLRWEHHLHVHHAACYLSYEHAVAQERLATQEVTLHPLFTLGEALDVGIELGLLQEPLVADFRSFLADPGKWQADRGYPLPQKE